MHRFRGIVNSVKTSELINDKFGKHMHYHHLYSNTLVYLEYCLKNMESEFLLNSMANVVNLSKGNTHHVVFVNICFCYNISGFS